MRIALGVRIVIPARVLHRPPCGHQLVHELGTELRLDRGIGCTRQRLPSTTIHRSCSAASVPSSFVTVPQWSQSQLADAAYPTHDRPTQVIAPRT